MPCHVQLWHGSVAVLFAAHAEAHALSLLKLPRKSTQVSSGSLPQLVPPGLATSPAMLFAPMTGSQEDFTRASLLSNSCTATAAGGRTASWESLLALLPTLCAAPPLLLVGLPLLLLPADGANVDRCRPVNFDSTW